jgi:hypothetical protein
MRMGDYRIGGRTVLGKVSVVLVVSCWTAGVERGVGCEREVGVGVGVTKSGRVELSFV